MDLSSRHQPQPPTPQNRKIVLFNPRQEVRDCLINGLNQGLGNIGQMNVLAIESFFNPIKKVLSAQSKLFSDSEMALEVQREIFAKAQSKEFLEIAVHFMICSPTDHLDVGELVRDLDHYGISEDVCNKIYQACLAHGLKELTEPFQELTKAIRSEAKVAESIPMSFSKYLVGLAEVNSRIAPAIVENINERGIKALSLAIAQLEIQYEEFSRENPNPNALAAFQEQAWTVLAFSAVTNCWWKTIASTCIQAFFPPKFPQN